MQKRAHGARFLLHAQQKGEKFLMKLFSKSFRPQGRGALVASRTRRNKTSAFLFANLFFAPPFCKEKVAMEFTYTNELFVDKKLFFPFSFDEIGANEKAIKKKSTETGAPPLPPQAFEKRKRASALDQNFLS